MEESGQQFSGQLGERMTAVVVDGQEGKEYRLPSEVELEAARVEPVALEALFARVVQAVIELAKEDSEERTTLESIQNHVRTQGGAAPAAQIGFGFEEAR